MKKKYGLLLCIVLCTLCAALSSCGQNPPPELPKEKEYRYEFEIFESKLAYVADIYPLYPNTPESEMQCDVYLELNGEKKRLLSSSPWEKDATRLRVSDTVVFSIKDDALVFETFGMDAQVHSGEKISAYLASHEILSGDYGPVAKFRLSANQYATSKDRLVLNSDGTGTLLSEPIRFYPISLTEAVVVKDDGSALCMRLDYSAKTYTTETKTLSYIFIGCYDLQNYPELCVTKAENIKEYSGEFQSASGTASIACKFQMNDRYYRCFSDYGLIFFGEYTQEGDAIKLQMKRISNGELVTDEETIYTDNVNKTFQTKPFT